MGVWCHKSHGIKVGYWWGVSGAGRLYNLYNTLKERKKNNIIDLIKINESRGWKIPIWACEPKCYMRQALIAFPTPPQSRTNTPGIMPTSLVACTISRLIICYNSVKAELNCLFRRSKVGVKSSYSLWQKEAFHRLRLCYKLTVNIRDDAHSWPGWLIHTVCFNPVLNVPDRLPH